MRADILPVLSEFRVLQKYSNRELGTVKVSAERKRASLSISAVMAPHVLIKPGTGHDKLTLFELQVHVTTSYKAQRHLQIPRSSK